MIHPLCTVEHYVSVSNINIESIVMEIRQWFPFFYWGTSIAVSARSIETLSMETEQFILFSNVAESWNIS